MDDQLEKNNPENQARQGRSYKASPLPVFKNDREVQDRETILLNLYAEICSSWRMLTDVRFKLLGFVPTVSVAALIALLSRSEPGSGLSPVARAAVIVFGLLITLGLWIYDRRNNELYDDLISRARRIETELRIDTGQFLGRRQPGHPLINHSNAVNLIYLTVFAGWLFALLAAALGWV